MEEVRIELERKLITDASICYCDLSDNDKKNLRKLNQEMREAIDECFKYVEENNPSEIDAFLQFLTEFNRRVCFFSEDKDNEWPIYREINWNLKYEEDFSYFERSVSILVKLINDSDRMIAIDNFLDMLISSKKLYDKGTLPYLIWDCRVKQLVMILVSNLYEYLNRYYPGYLSIFEGIILENAVDTINQDEVINKIWLDVASKIIYQYASDYIDYGSVQYDKAVCLLLRFGRTDLASYLIVSNQDNKRGNDINRDNSKGDFIKRIREFFNGKRKRLDD